MAHGPPDPERGQGQEGMLGSGEGPRVKVEKHLMGIPSTYSGCSGKKYSFNCQLEFTVQRLVIGNIIKAKHWD